jgi:hypothetical protein
MLLYEVRICTNMLIYIYIYICKHICAYMCYEKFRLMEFLLATSFILFVSLAHSSVLKVQVIYAFEKTVDFQ